MSWQVQVDYGHIACECNAICEIANGKLDEINVMLKRLEDTSTRLINYQTANLKAQIEKERENLLKKLQIVRQKAAEQAKQGIVTMDDMDDRYKNRNELINSTKDLQNTVDIISSEKIVEFEGLLQTLLKESLHENYRKMVERNSGVVSITDDVMRVIESLTDEMLKQYVYISYIKDNSLKGNALIEAGKALMNETYEDRYEKEVAKIRAELENARVEKKIVEKVTKKSGSSAKERLSEIRKDATKEIVDEKLRQKSLKIIRDAIKQRGFIVDKNNIKIDREKNVVNLVALKASGEKAKFQIFIDGKFIYDFRGYEGQACQKDIEPFLSDLEEVYGMNIKQTKEIWSNPDKISTMKYQAMNTNKNKG